jgi:hypothetical protein
VEYAGVGLRETAALRGDDNLEERSETSHRQPRALDAVDAVRHDPEPIGPSEVPQDGSAARQSIPALRKVVEVGATQTPGEPGVGSDLRQQVPEPLAGEIGLGYLTPTKGRPEPVVDPAVGGVDPGRVGEPQRAKSPLQGGALGRFVVEKGVIEIEEDSVDAVQGDYLAR